MPTRGRPIKRDSQSELVLLRPMVTRRYELRVDHDSCCGCKVCSIACPREAITLSEAVVEDGRVIKPARVDIDEATCSFCGECVVLCPTRSIELTVNGQPEIPVIKAEAFPYLIRRNRVTQSAVSGSTDASFIDDCPAEAISAQITRDEHGSIIAIRDVQVNKGACMACSRCMHTGPDGLFAVTKPYEGRASVDASKCPEGCQACVDVCPSNAITYDGERVHLDERFCLFCEACTRVCPVEDALSIDRRRINHTPIDSGAWTKALSALISSKAVAREFDIKGQGKRRRLLLGNEA
jgi:4Fe-4S ferredoxin